MRSSFYGLLGLSLGVLACSKDAHLRSDEIEAAVPMPELEVPAHYDFASRFAAGSSVEIKGQVLRFALIENLKRSIGGLQAMIDAAPDAQTAGQRVRDQLQYHYRFAGDALGLVAAVAAEDAIGWQLMPPALQSTYLDLGASTGSSASPQAKMPGREPAVEYRDYLAQGVIGWQEAGLSTPLSPEMLVEAWIAQVAALAEQIKSGPARTAPDGSPLTVAYLTADGLDLQQMLQKFLLLAVAYGRATDRYLEDGPAGKALDADNAQAVVRNDGSVSPYTRLEHEWDEAFGYFGAARDHANYTPEEVSARGGRAEFARGYHDADGDGRIDLLREFNFTFAGYAARRDLDSPAEASSQFGRSMMDDFLRGRALISRAAGALDETQRAELRQLRDRIVSTWDAMLAATVIHYLNATLRDMEAFGDPMLYKFAEHAKHWSEMKAFMLGLQFNPRRRLTDAQLSEMHAGVGVRPTLENAASEQRTAYRQTLLDIRAQLQAVYGFDQRQVMAW